MRKHHAAPSLPENHSMGMKNRKKPTKSLCAGNWLVVGVFLGVFLYVGFGKKNPPKEKVESKLNPYNIVNSIPGIYNIWFINHCLFNMRNNPENVGQIVPEKTNLPIFSTLEEKLHSIFLQGKYIE